MEQSAARGLPLLSARAQIKKRLGLGARGISLRWSALRPIADAVLTEMREFIDRSSSVSGDSVRFGPAPDVELPPVGEVNARYMDCMPSLQITPEVKWASIFQLILGREFNGVDPLRGLCFHNKAGRRTLSINAGATLWIASARNNHMRWWVKLETFMSGDDLLAKIVLPIVIKGSDELIKPFFEEIQVRKAGSRAATVHALKWMVALASPDIDGDDKQVIFATVAQRGNVIMNLSFHEPKRRMPRPRPRPEGESGDGEGGHGPGAKPDAPPIDDAAARGIRVDGDGHLDYDAELLDELARSLLTESAGIVDEDGELAEKWAALDGEEIEQDG
eukprot:2461179-Pyramimonas_sp.AAC.1